MAVHNFKNGSFSFHWNLPNVPGQQTETGSIYNNGAITFQIPKQVSPYTLAFTFVNRTIQSTLTSDGKDIPCSVTAFLNGQPQEMILDGNVWGPVSWRYTEQPVHNYYTGHYGVQASFIEEDGDVYEDYTGYNNFERPLIEVVINSKTSSDQEKNILKHLSQLIKDQKMTDVKFLVKGKEIGGHVAVLVAGSPVLATMFEANFKEKKQRVVEIEDIEPAIFKELLHFLYTGTAAKMDVDGVTDKLFVAADKYQVESLKILCEESLCRKLKLENVIDRLILAHLHSAPILFEGSCTFIEANGKDVWIRPEWRQLMKDYPDLFFLVSHRLIK